MNAASSRSHLVVTIHVSSLNRQTGHLASGKLAFVDLAGSERLKKSGSEGQALKEAAAINGSLSALGDVISALTSSNSSSSAENHHPSSSSSSSSSPRPLPQLQADDADGRLPRWDSENAHGGRGRADAVRPARVGLGAGLGVARARGLQLCPERLGRSRNPEITRAGREVEGEGRCAPGAEGVGGLGGSRGRQGRRRGGGLKKRKKGKEREREREKEREFFFLKSASLPFAFACCVSLLLPLVI